MARTANDSCLAPPVELRRVPLVQYRLETAEEASLREIKHYARMLRGAHLEELRRAAYRLFSDYVLSGKMALDMGLPIDSATTSTEGKR